MTPQITLHSEFISTEIVRIDVVGNRLPDHFLGMAFDLVLEGKWQLDRSELCGDFYRNDALIHLVSPQPQLQRIVFGMVFTDRQDNYFGNGCISRFYFKLDTVQRRKVFFEHATLSVDRNGRRDLADVQWQESSLNFQQEGLGPQQETMNGQGLVLQQEPRTQQYSQHIQHYGPFQTGKADLLSSVDPSLLNVYIALLVTFSFAVAIFVSVWLYFRLRKKG